MIILGIAAAFRLPDRNTEKSSVMNDERWRTAGLIFRLARVSKQVDSRTVDNAR